MPLARSRASGWSNESPRSNRRALETKAQVEKGVDDGRKINQVVARGSYGPEAARLWAVLRTGINDLARAYGLPPLGI